MVNQSPRSGFTGLDPARFGRARVAALGLLAAALVAALGLAGCGRKGGLDAPPMAAAGDLQPGQQPAPAQAPVLGTDGKPVPPAEKRKTFLDWLID